MIYRDNRHGRSWFVFRAPLQPPVTGVPKRKNSISRTGTGIIETSYGSLRLAFELNHMYLHRLCVGPPSILTLGLNTVTYSERINDALARLRSEGPNT